MNKEFKFTCPSDLHVYTARCEYTENDLTYWRVTWSDDSGETREQAVVEEDFLYRLGVWKAIYVSGWDGFFDKEKEEEYKQEYTGGSSNYYKVFVKNPTTLPEPYEAECNDIIEALKMNFAEGNAFKAIWRKAKARLGVKKKGYDNGLYDSEKVVFFGERMVLEAKNCE